MITNIHKNRMGTISFDGKFAGQRKPQDFIVYPIHSDGRTDRIMVQSDKRIGHIYMDDGRVVMTPSIAGGAYGHHLSRAECIDALTSAELFVLKSHIFATAHGAAGKAENGFIKTDNSGALNVFGVAA